MSKKSQQSITPKIQLIINCTLEILRDHGDQGLSMRKVAAKAGMSLGNLQYYFRNKDELLIGLADVYFEKCSDDFNKSIAKHAPQGKTEILEFLVDYGMYYANSESGKVFRELWGVAARNERINERMYEYYRLYAESVTEIIRPFAKNHNSVANTVSLLIPFFDGYGFSSSPLPADTPMLASFLVNIINTALEGGLE
ncbi:TetR/AcrR family transcriptional regulator [Maridesulfovibrio sp.]|uniref:TetR/AcrR family transcriptional regulator n=1 Tax=Maridesulfovibrio sp. TaxID=2795000 RepID=UPI0029F4EA43|nr:TetR/AcrR family transcriptional regulator [Maridesulfovibrio sp.]